MGIPLQYGIKHRITQTGDYPSGKAIPELTLLTDKSTLSSISGATLMFDGDVDTGGGATCPAGSSGKYLYFDMGTWFALNGVNTIWQVNFSHANLTVETDLSADFINWTNIDNVTNPGTSKRGLNYTTAQKFMRWIRFKMDNAGVGGTEDSVLTVYNVMPMV